MSLWTLSVVMRKAVDTIGNRALMEARRSRNVLKEYAAVILLLYVSQKASVNHRSEFQIQQRVKQGDILSAVPFHSVLDMAFDI